MSTPDDVWPVLLSTLGTEKHFHAIGVITSRYNALENGIFELVAYYLRIHDIPNSVIEFMYLSLPENRRKDAARLIFRDCEDDKYASGLMDNLLDHYEWCSDSRNRIAHSEHYAFNRETFDKIKLSKRKNKTSTERITIDIDVETLRMVADEIETCRLQAIQIFIYLVCRDKQPQKFEDYIAIFSCDTLPEKLAIPTSLDSVKRP